MIIHEFSGLVYHIHEALNYMKSSNHAFGQRHCTHFCRLQGVMRGMVLERSEFGKPNTRKPRQSSASCGPTTLTTSSKQIHRMPEGENKQDKQATQAQARQVIDVFHEISTLLVGNFVAWRGIPTD